MLFFKNSASANYEKIFYDLNIESISGEIINFGNFKDKVVLVVNTASYCGFTKQYEDLQNLWVKYNKKGLIVLGVPSNSFNQEKSENSDVKEFYYKFKLKNNELERFLITNYSDTNKIDATTMKDLEWSLKIELSSYYFSEQARYIINTFKDQDVKKAILELNK